MIVLLTAALAFAHGGEDHSAPAPVAAAATSSAGHRLPTWSTEFEAIVTVPDGEPGEALKGTVLVADFATSAPIPAAQLDLTFQGPNGPVAATSGPATQPGVFPWTASFPVEGAYTGGLQVIADEGADALGLPRFVWGPEEAHEHGLPGWVWTAALGLGALATGLTVGAGVGFGMGRAARRALPVVVGGLLVGAADRVSAHGGEDHGAPAAPTAISGGDVTLPMESQFLLGVRTEVTWPGGFVPAERLLGRAVIRPGGGAELAAPVAGTLHFTGELVPGMMVRAGQELARLEESLAGPDRANVVASGAAARIAVATARQQLAIAERDAASAEQLGGVLSERERLERRQALEVARESVAQAEIAAARAGSSETTIRSPMSGRLATIGPRPGESVEAGRPLFTVVADGPLWVEAQVPEAVAARLVEGAAARITMDARPGDVLGARVLDPGLAVDPNTGTARVTLVVDDNDTLRPGMAVTGWVDLGSPTPDALSVPEDAIVESNGETLLFVKTGPETFDVRRVAVGPSAAGRRQITSGLAPQERVVVSGTYSLRSVAGR